MKTYILTIITVLTLLTVAQQVTAQVSVSVPRHVEQDVQRINEILNAHSSLTNNYQRQLEDLQRKITTSYRNFQLATTDEARSRYHDEVMLNRAQLYQAAQSHFTEIRSLADQILPLANRLANSDINSQAITRSLNTSLSNANIMLKEVEVEIRRSTLVLAYANFDAQEDARIDQMVGQIVELREQISRDKELIQQDGSEAIRHFESFSGSFLENIGTLTMQVRNMRMQSERILNRVRFNASVDLQIMTTRGAMDRLNVLLGQLDKIAIDFPKSVENTDNIMRSYFDMFDGIMTPRNVNHNFSTPTNRTSTREERERRLSNNNR
jgi:hypothetical protein